MHFRALFGQGVLLFGLLFASASASTAACAIDVTGTWNVRVSGVPEYTTSIHANGTLQSHCAFCQAQTWTCSGRTFTVYGPGSTVIRHTIVSDTLMQSSYGTVSRSGPAKKRQPPADQCGELGSLSPQILSHRNREYAFVIKNPSHSCAVCLSYTSCDRDPNTGDPVCTLKQTKIGKGRQLEGINFGREPIVSGARFCQ